MGLQVGSWRLVSKHSENESWPSYTAVIVPYEDIYVRRDLRVHGRVLLEQILFSQQ